MYELLYFTLYKCSQFSTLPLLMRPGSPSPVTGFLEASVEVMCLNLTGVVWNLFIVMTWSNFLSLSARILETEKSCMELDVQNTENGYVVTRPLVQTVGFRTRWRIL